MANLKEIRTRIVSVNSTMQITSAMKMVSAAKLKRAQDAITKMRPYAEKLQEILSNVSSAEANSDFRRNGDVKNTLIVAITSNRGLCGGFNNNIIKEARLVAKQSSGNVKLLSLGKKANDAFKRSELHTTEGFSETPFTIFDALTFSNVSEL
ncbi:MAG: F0F1 ATP synthase subunit gamma, partial [Bacteroidota bacterium]